MNAAARTSRLRTIARRTADLDVEYRLLLARQAKLETAITNNRAEVGELGTEEGLLLDEIHPSPPATWPAHLFTTSGLIETARTTARA